MSLNTRTALTASFFLLMAMAAFFALRRSSVAVGPTVDQELASHQSMLREFQRIHRAAQFDNTFFETESVRRAAEQVERNAAVPPQERMIQHVSLAIGSRRLGDIETATQRMLEAESLLAKAELVPEYEVRFYYEAGLTFLREGETKNCVHCRTGESCIFPIQPGGVHTKIEGSRTAMAYFRKVLERDPGHLKARWLLNIAAMTLGEYPESVPAELRIPEDRLRSTVEFPRFLDVSADIGLKTVSCAGGVIVDDFDNDGRYDVMTSNWKTDGQLRYFRNSGDGNFVERTDEAGLAGVLGGLNLIQADYDNDGDLDALVLRGGWMEQSGRMPVSLLKNLGGGKFRDVSRAVGLGDFRGPTQTGSWGDYDNDGDVDLFLGNEEGLSTLYRNDGGAMFVDVTQESGIARGGYIKGVIWGDYNGDRLPDLYLSNRHGFNTLYRNAGNGRFVDATREAGVPGPGAGFATWFWDVNNDGRLDLYASSYDVDVEAVARDYFGLPMTAEPDRLYLQQDDGTFRDVATEFGVTCETLPMGANFGDLDNDGFPDFYLGTGSPGYDALMPNVMFHNRGGKAFEDVTFAGGFGHLQKGHGVSFVDLDNDGDQDVFIQIGGAFPGDAFGDVVFENPGFSNHWLRVKVIGTTSNRAGIGVRLKATFREGDETRSVYQWVNSGGSFGARPLTQQMGLGGAERIDRLEVLWPATGETQVFEHVPVDISVEITEGAADFVRREMPPIPFARRPPTTTDAPSAAATSSTSS